jgi:hypothetical protein
MNAPAQDLLLELIKSIESLTGHNLPAAYDDAQDDAGRCPYCRSWNMDHIESCAVVIAEAVAVNAQKFVVEPLLE